MKITTLDAPSLSILRKEIDAAIKVIADKYGIHSITSGNASLEQGRNSGNLKLEIVVSAESQDKLASEEWDRYAHLFDLPKGGVGQIITVSNTRIKITGIDAKKPKNCVVGVGADDNKGYSMPPVTAIAGLKKLGLVYVDERRPISERLIQTPPPSGLK